MSSLETFHSILKKHRQSATKARLAVFSALLGQEPMSMHELVEKTAKQADRSSVYRAVDLFEQIGIAQRLNTGWKYKIELTDAFTDHHHHLTCTECGRTIALNETYLEEVVDKLGGQHGFTVTGHQIELQGLCPSCRSKNI